MTFRTALPSDIRALFSVRMSVKENVLVSKDLVTDEICEQYLTVRGKGWVCEIDGHIVGFTIADMVDNSIWALFVRPEYERMGIGKKLQDIMLSWYFGHGKQAVWLTTAPGTRAEHFYRSSGWRETGSQNSEIRFELSVNEWNSRNTTH